MGPRPADGRASKIATRNLSTAREQKHSSEACVRCSAWIVGDDRGDRWSRGGREIAAGPISQEMVPPTGFEPTTDHYEARNPDTTIAYVRMQGCAAKRFGTRWRPGGHPFRRPRVPLHEPQRTAVNDGNSNRDVAGDRFLEPDRASRD